MNIKIKVQSINPIMSKKKQEELPYVNILFRGDNDDPIQVSLEELLQMTGEIKIIMDNPPVPDPFEDLCDYGCNQYLDVYVQRIEGEEVDSEVEFDYEVEIHGSRREGSTNHILAREHYTSQTLKENYPKRYSHIPKPVKWSYDWDGNKSSILFEKCVNCHNKQQKQKMSK